MKTERYSTSRRKYIATGRFVVVVGDYNTRSEQSARQGGTVRDEVGTNQLVESVRRLLTGQDLGLEIDYFEPGGSGRCLTPAWQSGQCPCLPVSSIPAGWSTRWRTANGTERGAEADRLFNRYHGRLSDPDPDLLRIGTQYGADICGLDELREQQHEQNEG